MADNQVVEAAKEHFGKVLEGQLERVENLKAEGDWTDYTAISPIVIGVLGGDGIGPTITAEAQNVLEYLLKGAGGQRQGGVPHHRRADHREPRREAPGDSGRRSRRDSQVPRHPEGPYAHP